MFKQMFFFLIKLIIYLTKITFRIIEILFFGILEILGSGLDNDELDESDQLNAKSVYMLDYNDNIIVDDNYTFGYDLDDMNKSRNLF